MTDFEREDTERRRTQYLGMVVRRAQMTWERVSRFHRVQADDAQPQVLLEVTPAMMRVTPWLIESAVTELAGRIPSFERAVDGFGRWEVTELEDGHLQSVRSAELAKNVGGVSMPYSLVHEQTETPDGVLVMERVVLVPAMTAEHTPAEA